MNLHKDWSKGASGQKKAKYIKNTIRQRRGSYSANKKNISKAEAPSGTKPTYK